jgi:hypothetical protein
MKRISTWGMLLAGLALLQPTAAADPKKDDKKQPSGRVIITPPPAGVDLVKKGDKPDLKAAGERLVASGAFNGKLLSVDNDTVTIHYIYRYAVIRPEPYQRLLELQQEWINAYQLEDPNQALQALQNIYAEALEQQKNLYEIKEKEYDLILDKPENFKVRVWQLPVLFDDEGKPRRRTAAELKEAKGPGNLPGYIAKPDDLKPGQMVRVYFTKKKAEANPIVPNPDPITLSAALVLIVSEPEPEPPSQPDQQ